jgi:hypothetical protein
MNDQTVLRGGRWSSFYKEEGGLQDILAEIGKTYIERMSQVEPWETDKLSKLAMANKIVGELDNCIRKIMADGEIAHHNIEHIKQIEKLPYAKRRFL